MGKLIRVYTSNYILGELNIDKNDLYAEKILFFQALGCLQSSSTDMPKDISLFKECFESNLHYAIKNDKPHSFYYSEGKFYNLRIDVSVIDT